MSEQKPKFTRAGHPTAANGDCPICYSKGYEEAELALEARAEQAEAERDELRKRVEVISMDLIKTHNRVLELEAERDSR